MINAQKEGKEPKAAEPGEKVGNPPKSKKGAKNTTHRSTEGLSRKRANALKRDREKLKSWSPVSWKKGGERMADRGAKRGLQNKWVIIT